MSGFKAIMAVAAFSIALGCNSSGPEQKGDSLILSLDDPGITISAEAKAALESVGFTKCAMPFGVLIGADKDMPDDYVITAINVVAEMIDLDKDGNADDPAVLAEVSKWKERAWLAMPMDRDKWDSEQLPKLRGVLGYDIIIPDWWMRTKPTGPDARARAVIVEEISHFLAQFGYGIVYPAQFGSNDWTSVIAKETQRAQCDWWQHPENDCPGSPATSEGDCSGPSCDVLEFYQQVATLRAGMQPGWFGIGFPKTKEELETLLSQEIKDVMDDPKYHQINRPLTFDYYQTVGTSHQS
jgi:hypothetical protein